LTWHPEEGQPAPGRGFAILAATLALLLALAAAAVLYAGLAVRGGAALPGWLSPALAAWLGANGLPLLAGGALLVGLLALLAVRRAWRVGPQAVVPDAAEDGAVDRLRRQLEPLATGDLDVWLPDEDGPVGEIHRTLNLLVGGVADLVAAADDAAVQLLGAVQDGRGGLSGLRVEAERGRQLADEVLEHARHALSAARALGARTRLREAPARGPAGAPSPAAPPLATRLDGIVEVVNDLAEQAHVLAVGVSVQAAAAGAPPALRALGDDVQLLAEQAGRAVGRLGPLVKAALEEPPPAPADSHLAAAERAAGGSAAGRRVAEQVATLAELVASLRAGLDRVARAQDDAAVSLGALAELAHRLRRATARFRLRD
jgi:hypothetical protein